MATPGDGSYDGSHDWTLDTYLTQAAHGVADLEVSRCVWIGWEIALIAPLCHSIQRHMDHLLDHNLVTLQDY